MAQASQKSTSAKVSTLQSAIPTFTPKTGLSDAGRKNAAERLAAALSDMQIALLKTQGVHWAAAGPTFYGLHHLTEEHYRAMFEAIDELAERIRALGHSAPASFGQYLDAARLPDTRAERLDVAGMVDMLVADHEAICRRLRADIDELDEGKDFATVDMLTKFLAFHEKAVWMLRATRAK